MIRTRRWPFYSPAQVVETAQRWLGLCAHAFTSPHCAEAVELGAVARTLAATADAARSGIRTDNLKNLHVILRQAPAGPLESFDMDAQGTHAWFIAQATNEMHEVHSWAAQLIDGIPLAATQPGTERRPTEADLSPNHRRLLQRMVEKGTTAIVVDLAWTGGPGRKTMGKLIDELCRWGLAHRPLGPRKGVAATEEGKAIVASK
jgi:hypothetical protein